MAEEVNLLQVTFITMMVIFVAILLLTVLSPLVDSLGHALTMTDSRSFPGAGMTMATVHDYFYYVTFACVGITIIWWLKSVWATYQTYTRKVYGQ